MTVLDQAHSRRRFLQLTGAVGATAALGGVLQACNVIGGGAATTGTFNWMTWATTGSSPSSTRSPTDTKISTAISELSGNAEGYAKLKEVKGQLDKMSADAMWVPNAYAKDSLIEPFDINELKVSTQLYSFAREFPYWQSSDGYMAYPFGWSPIMIYLRPGQRQR
jgi:spermidine/putrescine-binding protein